jgi:hypothetical protein
MKNGSTPIPKIAYSLAGDAHLSAADELITLIERFTLDTDSGIGQAIFEAAETQIRVALKYRILVEEKTSGRPRKRVGLIPTELNSNTAKKTLGRPNKMPKAWDVTVYLEVEKERSRLREKNINAGSVTGAIESILRTRMAPVIGTSQRQTLRTHKDRTRAAYYRGKKSFLGGSKV